jgi:acyl carrier protein
LQEIAPETNLRNLSPDDRLRDVLQLDALDFLNFIIAVHETLRVDVPEGDYPQLATLDGCVDYLARARREPAQEVRSVSPSTEPGTPRDADITGRDRSR